MRNISSAIAAEIIKANAIPRTLYHLELQDKATGATNHLYFTNHGSNISFGGQTYQSYKINHSAIKTYFKNQVDSCKVTVDNTDKGFSAYFAYNEFEGQNAEIWKIFLDANLNPIGTAAAGDYIVQFKGMMDHPIVEEQQCEITIVSIFNREQSYTPWRRFTAKCNWRFCGTECGYNNGTQPRGAADSGSTTTLIDTNLVGGSSMVGGFLKILTGSNKNEVRRISAHNTGTGQATVEGSYPYAIISGDGYIVECDKSKSTCKGFIGSQIQKFGGFDDTVSYTTPQVVSSTGTGGSATIGWIINGAPWPDLKVDSAFVPLVYGSGVLEGKRIDEHYTSGNPSTGDRIYAFCEGQIDSIPDVYINGKKITNYSTYLGTTSQSFQFHGETKYYARTAAIGTQQNYGDMWNTGGGDAVTAVIRGLIIQKYLANGNPDGSPVWSQNPIWCLLDFLLNRASKKLDPSLIDYTAAYNTAATVDALGYKLNMVITEQKKDAEIIDLMLISFRGYITYLVGKLVLNLEKAWSGAAAHTFDDASGGTTQDNIIENSFHYFQEDVNDSANRIVVSYLDQEVRKTIALTNGFLPAANTTIPYSDLQGSFTASGTIYISGEAITYTGNSGTQLTGCSARTKDYASGYPLFQGAQAYPEMTAIANDYDNQDKTKRVIEKKIDGRAIPTYRQAYALAEWMLKKSLANTKCKLTGMIDSLKLTVGDMVEITHALPGWVSEKFRIIEAEENENEEVGYTLEVYDASFYNESDTLPGVILATTLPNPWAVPGHVTNLSLSEDGYANTDSSYVPTLTLTYALPSDAIFWDRAKVQININGGNYRDYGVDTSRGTGYNIDAATGKFKSGDTVYIKVISISYNNIYADATTAPTVSNKIDGLVVAPAAIRGLCIEGNPDPNDTTWDGLRFSLTWWKSSQTGGAGKEGSLGAGGFVDPYWNGDEFELWVGGACIHSGMTKAARYDYIYGDGYLSFLDSKIAATNGTVTFKVRRVLLNQPSEWAAITISQKIPANPANLTATGMSKSAFFTWENNTEADFSHYSIRTKVGAGGAWGAWNSIRNNNYIRALTDTEATGGSVIIYIETKAVDVYGNASGVSSSNVGTWLIIPDALYTTIRTDFWVRDSIFYFTAATLTWTAGSITRGADTFTLAVSTLANANNKYVIATLSGGAATLSLADMTAGIPTLNANQVIIATTSSTSNTAGNYICYIRQANSMQIEGATMRDATITDAKITGTLSASKIDVLNGAVTISGTGGAGTLFYLGNTAQWTEIAGAGKPENNATVGAIWGGNLTGRPVELTDGRVATALNAAGTVVTKVVPTSVAGPGAAGLYLGSDYLGYYNGSAWKTYMQNNGNFSLSGTGTHNLAWDGTTLTIRGSLNADDITAGTITGRTLQTAASGKRFVVSSSDGEAHFYNTAGVEVATIGLRSTTWPPDTTILTLGSSTSGYANISAVNKDSVGATILTYGTLWTPAMQLWAETGFPLEIYLNTSPANTTNGHLYMQPLAAKPSQFPNGGIMFYNGKLCYADGTNWRRVSDDVIV